MAESLVIVEYVDEINPATFAVYSTTGEQQQKALKEAQEGFKTLEEALTGKKFFGGETIGFVDIATGWLPRWVRVIEEIVGVSIVNENNLPLINAWFDDFMELELVKGSLPSKDKLYAFNKARREKLLA
ncbi:putative Glutathione transferase GST 23 [Cocos nucifera]|uniref:Putative Glutathione transferase GST 23 n=1 Tax=Cocos nucifera TaxID=13894 RepID=A0A8K0NBB9_COCNU|nr:putative Glutathione transferase GST 23 [Cocos nucifera]